MSRIKNVLVVGSGSIGERHLRCFLATGRAKVSLCEIDPALRTRIAQQYDVNRVYADLSAALVDRHDAAVIATPAHLHISMAAQLAEAGTHVLIEKPLSTDMVGVDSLAASLRQQNVRASVAYVLRHHPALRAMHSAVVDGRFGRAVQLVAVCGQHFPTYRPAYRQIYYANRATGGGAVQDALTHLMNAGQWLVGPVDRLVADAAHRVLPGVDVEDTVHVIARHGNLLASYSLNQHQAPNENMLTVICERGTCRCELHRNRWMWMTAPESAWQKESFDSLERDDLFVAQANAFLELVDGRAQPSCTLAEAVQTLAANLAVLSSVQDGTWKELGAECRKIN